jgi:hypothetical protein
MGLILAGIISYFTLFTSIAAATGTAWNDQVIPGDSITPVFPAQVGYHFDTLKGKTVPADFSTRYAEEEREIILAINRISSSLIRKGRVLVMPDSLVADKLLYAPYPDSLAGFDSIPKLVLISRRVQAFAIYENGWLVRWGPVSSGKKSTPTPAGLFHTNFKALVKISSENSSWIMPWYFNFYARRGIAMHQYFLPGYPASHACVRMQEKDAKWIFDWADQWKLSARTGAVLITGTPVIIFGDYNYGKKAPWLMLPDDNRSTMVTTEELEEISAYLPVIHKDVVLKK